MKSAQMEPETIRMTSRGDQSSGFDGQHKRVDDFPKGAKDAQSSGITGGHFSRVLGVVVNCKVI